MATVVGIGNPLWDVFAPAASNPAAAELAAPGSISHIEAPRMAEIVDGLRDAVWVPGGGARNALVALAALGYTTYLVGAVGDDERAEGYRRTLSPDGIADCLVAAEAPTGVCLTLTGGGSAGSESRDGRAGPRIIVAPAAAIELSAVFGLAPRGPDIVFLEGFLAPRTELATEAVAYAAEAGARVVVDLGHPGVASQAAAIARRAVLASTPGARRQGVRELLLFATEGEARAAGGPARLLEPDRGRDTESGGTGTSGTGGAATDRAAPVTLCVKRGAAGASVHTADGEIRCPAVHPPNPNVVDTTGAGDIFAGAFVAAWTAGGATEECCRFASQAAALSLGRYGGRLGTEASRELVELFGRITS